MKSTQVSVRYARSLFEFAVEQHSLEAVYKDVLLLNNVCKESKDFRLLLKSPIIQTKKKEKIITGLFSKEISELTLSFMILLVRRRREPFIPEIAAEFVEQYQDYMNILPVTVKSAAPLTEESRKRIVEIMTNYSRATVDISGTVDPELIGGFVLYWKDKQYDASVSHQIERLKRSIAKVNLYIKEF